MFFRKGLIKFSKVIYKILSPQNDQSLVKRNFDRKRIQFIQPCCCRYIIFAQNEFVNSWLLAEYFAFGITKLKIPMDRNVVCSKLYFIK